MENENEKVKESVKQLNIIYLALIAGQIMFFAVVIFLLWQQGALLKGPQDFKNIMNYVALLFTFSSIPLGYFVYNQQCKQGINLTSIDEKLIRYRTASIIKYALFEGANFVNILALFFTNGQTFIMLFLIMIIVFLINKPSENRFNIDLWEEQSNNP
jgi:hypothetical protein